MKAESTLDARGTMCPIPIIWTADRIRGMRPGEVLEILATDEAILEDLPAWCRVTGNDFLGFEVEEPVYRGYARRAGRAPGEAR